MAHSVLKQCVISTCLICCVVIVFAFRALVVWLVFSISDSMNNSNALDITTGTGAATCNISKTCQCPYFLNSSPLWNVHIQHKYTPQFNFLDFHKAVLIDEISEYKTGEICIFCKKANSSRYIDETDLETTLTGIMLGWTLSGKPNKWYTKIPNTNISGHHYLSNLFICLHNLFNPSGRKAGTVFLLFTWHDFFRVCKS